MAELASNDRGVGQANRSWWTSTFVALLVFGMAAGTLGPPALGIIAPSLLRDFAISRGELGIVLGVPFIVGALASPFAGRIADRAGGRNALVATLVSSAISFLGYALAQSFIVLVAIGLVSGWSMALCNPATNKLIADCLNPGGRGTATGLKQSGPFVGIALAGILVPVGVQLIGWRATLLVIAALVAVIIPVTYFVIPGDQSHDLGHLARLDSRVFRRILPLSVYGFLLGFSGSVILAVPLYVTEHLGLNTRQAGLAATTIAVAAIVGRVFWAKRAELQSRFRPILSLLSLITIVGAALLAVASTATALLWPGAALMGLSAAAWTSVGMIAVMALAETQTGAASGLVWLGFLGGFGLGPFAYGAIADSTGSYIGIWAVVAIAAVASWASLLRWKH